MNAPKWYDKLAHGETREARKDAGDNLHRRLVCCGIGWSEAFNLAWYYTDQCDTPGFTVDDYEESETIA